MHASLQAYIQYPLETMNTNDHANPFTIQLWTLDKPTLTGKQLVVHASSLVTQNEVHKWQFTVLRVYCTCVGTHPQSSATPQRWHPSTAQGACPLGPVGEGGWGLLGGVQVRKADWVISGRWPDLQQLLYGMEVSCQSSSMWRLVSNKV